jgi:hypothetical protein
MNSPLLKTLSSKWWALWIVFFVYSAAAAAAVQFIILFALPQTNLGHGLFVPDSTGFHQIALKVAGQIVKQGWSAWELRPGGQYPAGIASIFYYLWRPEPYAMIPFNAVLHATAGSLVYFLLGTFISNPLVALAGSTLFVMNPASFEWTAQIHKDGTFILGNLLVLTAWMILLKSADRKRWWEFFVPPLLTLIGSFLIWASRPYWNQVSITACIIMLIITFITWLPGILRHGDLRLYRIAGLIIASGIIALQIPFVDRHYSLVKEAEFIRSEHLASSAGNLQSESSQPGPSQTGRSQAGSSQAEPSQTGRSQARPFQAEPSQTGRSQASPSQARLSEKEISAREQTEIIRTGRPEAFMINWVRNPYIPFIMESRLYSLSFFRLVTGSQGGKTIIDRHIIFESISDYIRYLPRAAQIGFLSPFPSFWIGQGSIPANTIGRMILGTLTACSYVCLFFLFLSIRQYYRNLRFWLILVFSTFGLFVFTYGYPNVGTLNRMRYGFYMMMVVAGFAFAVLKIIEYRNNRIRVEDPSVACPKEAASDCRTA